MKNQKGFSLIACLLVCSLLAAIVVAYSQWIRVKSVGAVHRLGSQNALAYAESSLNLAMNALRDPAFFADGPPAPIAYNDLDRGRAEVVFIPDAANPTHPTLVEARSTAYYYLPAGNVMDGGKPAQRAVVEAKISMSEANAYFAAVPMNLTITYGTDAGVGGSIYARNLFFESGPGTATKVDKVFYSERVFRCDPPSCVNPVEDSAPAFVDFTGATSAAVKLPAPPNLTTLGGIVERYYSSHATVDPTPMNFSGAGVAPPSDGPPKVFFINGDLNIGLGGPLTVNGAYLIYVTGNVNIHNNIQMSNPGDPDTNWIAILAEGNITIAAAAPFHLELSGTFLTNGAFRTEAAASPKGNLTFLGGFLAHQGVSLSRDTTGTPTYQGIRTYTYRTSASPNIVLPNFTTLISYRVIQGKHSQ